MTPDPYRHADPPPLPDGHTVPHTRLAERRAPRYGYRIAAVVLLVVIGVILGVAL